MIPAIFSEFLVVPQGALRQQPWKPVKIPWGILSKMILTRMGCDDLYVLVLLITEMFDLPCRRQVQTPSRPSRSLSSITRVVRRGESFLVLLLSLYSNHKFLKSSFKQYFPPFLISFFYSGESVTGADSPGVDANGNSFDFTTKLLHLAWHPSENSIACAAANSLYMYYA